jgi:hypothetical protein
VAVAVVVDGMRHVFRRHELRLTKLAGPGADHLLGPEVAPLDDPEGVEQMGPEHVRAAAVIGERGNRLDRVVFTLACTEVALETPERGDHRRRHPEFLLLAIEQGPVLLDLGHAACEPPARQHLAGHLQEGLREEALATVDVDDALVEHQVGRGGLQGARRDALRQRLALEVGEPAAEVGGIAAVGLSQGRHARNQRCHDRQS